MHQPHSTRFPGQSPTNTEVPGSQSPHRPDSDGSPVERGGRPSVDTATRRFQNSKGIMRELNKAGLKMQTVNDLLTMYVGAASQDALRTTFVPEAEALSFDTEIVAYWSQLAGRDVTSPLFHLPLRMGGLGVGSAVQRRAAVPWTGWQSVIPTLMAATDSPDTDSLFAATPILRSQLHHLQFTLARQMKTPSLLLEPLGAALQPRHEKHLSTPSNAPHATNSWTATSTTPSRSHPSYPKQPKTQAPTSNSLTAKPTKRMTDASRYHWPASSCWHTLLRVAPPTSHPPVRRSALPSEFAPAHRCPSTSLCRMQEWGGVDQRTHQRQGLH